MIVTRRTIPWAAVFRNLAERYHWTFQQIGDLTMYQTMVAAGAWAPEDIFFRKRQD